LITPAVGTGIVTALPLIWFAASARKLPLTTIGLLQFTSPSATFLLGVFLYDEPFSGNEVKNVNVHYDEIRDKYADEGEYPTTPTRSAEETAAWLREFHTALADKLSRDETGYDLIP